MAPTVLPLQCCGAYSAAPVRWSVPGRKNPQMAEVVLFHHAQGLTPGVVAFADDLRAAGHTVHTPDLFEGRTFATFEEGLGHAQETGFGEVMERGSRAVEGLPPSWSTPASPSACCPPSGSPRPVPAPAALCCSTPACRRRSSARGPPVSGSRCTAWTPTRCSSARATSTRPGPSSPKP